MLSEEQKRQFERDGYILVPGILNHDQVSRLRSFFRPEFDRPAEKRGIGDTDKVLMDIYSRYPESRWLLFHEPALSVVGSLLGDDFLVLRESAVHLNMFVDWHKDTSAQEKSGHTFQWEDDYQMVEVGYYLQDNTEEYGGGLDVVPGSHRSPDTFYSQYDYSAPVKGQATGQKMMSLTSTVFDKIRYRIGVGTEESVKDFVSIPNKAGDLLIFDFRITHRATRARRKIDAAHEKMAIFTACSRNNRHAKAYSDFITQRPTYTYLQNFSYPPDFLSEAASRKVNLY
ncbi:MAG TPA: phytanoyl-CoA dioxygenase family protein [Blastocatellia bacterium]|nr:phytanoyl-CoA dioxygenase family protein [Blastocatellia bacterium]